jgi:hypothetical protein
MSNLLAMAQSSKGGANLLKGPQYEYRLALHFMVRAILHDYHDFALACNLPAAGKFDDVVFRYQRAESDQVKYRLVQAKNVNRTVGLQQLLNKEGDFSIAQYFSSYQQIVSSSEFNGQIEDIIISTTARVDASPSFSLNNSDEEVFTFLGSPSKRYNIK